MNGYTYRENYNKGRTEVLSELNRAYEAMTEGNFRLVVDIAKRVLIINEKTPQSHYLIGRVTIETGQFDIALASFEKAVKQDESSSDYWAFLALVYSLTGNMVKAETAVTH